MSRYFRPSFAFAAVYVVVFATDAHADTYAIIDSSAGSISRGAAIDAAQAIELATGEAISFMIRENGASVQRKCIGPFKGEIRRCTNNVSRSPAGIPGGSRGDE